VQSFTKHYETQSAWKNATFGAFQYDHYQRKLLAEPIDSVYTSDIVLPLLCYSPLGLQNLLSKILVFPKTLVMVDPGGTIRMIMSPTYIKIIH